MELKDVLDQISDLTGWKQVQLAKNIGVSQGTISKWRNGQQSPRKEEWDRVIDLISRNSRLIPMRSQALSGGDVRIMGRIGAGATIEPDFEQVPPEGLSEKTLPFPVSDGLIAFEVVGDSMLPKYENGDIIVVLEEQARSTESFIGRVAAVRTGDGRRYLKRIEVGAKTGLYRLESFNAAPIHDVEIAWVGEIRTIVPGEQVFAVERMKPAKRTTAKAAR